MDCFTTNPSVFEYYKIQPSIKSYPDWWKKLPASGSDWKETAKNRNLFGTNTMKSCAGFIELYKRSFSLLLWSDLRLFIGSEENPSYTYQFADRKSEITVHSSDQHGGAFGDEKFQHLKIHSPWFCLSKTNINWCVIPSIWSLLKTHPTVNMLSGVVNFKAQTSTNIVLFIQRTKEDQYLEFSAGTVVSQLLPMTEKNVCLKHHLVDETELSRLKAKHSFDSHNIFSSSFLKMKKKVTR